MEPDNRQNLLNALFESGLSTRDLGGLSLTRAISYQLLYCLRIFEQIVRGEYSDYGTDVLEDYIAWDSPNSGEFDRVLIVQVKTAGNRCFLSLRRKVESVLKGFETSAKILRQICKPREVCFRLVVNQQEGCEFSCAAEAELYRQDWFKSRCENIQSLLLDSAVKVDVEHYLSFAFGFDELIKRLKFLKEDSPGFYRLLQSEQGMDTMVQAIVGASLPLWHDRSRRTRQKEQCQEALLFLFSNHRGRDEVVESIQAGFNRVADRIYEQRKQASFDAQRTALEMRATQFLHSATHTKALQPNRLSLKCRDRETTLKALKVCISMPSSSWHFSIFRQQFTAVHHDPTNGSYILSAQCPEESLSVRERLATEGFGHESRVALLLSFADCLAEWSEAGIALLNFRGGIREYADLYRVLRFKDGDITFHMGDLEVLSIRDSAASVVDPHWLPGRTIARALRFLYNGNGALNLKSSRSAAWNDHLINEVVAVFRRSPIEDARYLKADLMSAFEDEIYAIPLFFHDVDEQFICDIHDAGFSSVYEALMYCKLTAILWDRGANAKDVYYCFSNDAQIGVIRTREDSFTLFRYIRYGTLRAGGCLFYRQPSVAA